MFSKFSNLFPANSRLSSSSTVYPPQNFSSSDSNSSLIPLGILKLPYIEAYYQVASPYMHESRHRHAMRRPRGSGGRFLNTKSLDSVKEANGIGGGKTIHPTASHNSAVIQSRSAGNKTVSGQALQRTGSHSSEFQQSDGGTLNSSKDTNGSNSNISGSEVTSMYSRGELDSFQVSHLGLAIHSLSDVMDIRRGIVMPSKWVAAVDNCCHLKV